MVRIGSKRGWLTRVGTVAMMIAVVGVLLAACGGSDSAGGSGEKYPVFAGAVKLDTAKLSTEDMPVDAKGAGSAVFTSEEPFSEVAGYYESGIASEGWSIAESMPTVPDMISIQSISKGASVAMVTIMDASFAGAESSASMFDAADVDVDAGDLEGANTVIVILHFTCEEANLADCVSALTDA